MLYTHMTDEALVVGARNILYKLSVDELRLKQTLTWNSVELDRDSCLVKGKVAPMRFHEIFVLTERLTHLVKQTVLFHGSFTGQS